MTNSSTPEPVDLSDPSISPHRLQELAQTHPEQWDEILAHPNVYQGLADWIRDRQAELAATGDDEPSVAPEIEAEDDAQTQAEVDETATFAAVQPDPATHEEQPDEEDSSFQDAAEVPDTYDERPIDTSDEQADPFKPAEQPETTELPESTVEDEQLDEPAGDSAWALPDASKLEQPQQQFYAQTSETGAAAWSGQAAQDTPQAEQPAPEQQQQQSWGWTQPSGQQQFRQSQAQPSAEQSQQQFGYPHYGQSYGQTPQPGQPRQFGQTQQPYPARRPRSGARIDLSSARTWGLFVAGGAAFLSLFGYLFAPALDFTPGFATHLSSGGWIILLLLIATVALSLLQLLKPSPWMRFFFIAVSLGAAFMTIGRTVTLMGYLSMRYTSFSTLWLLFMAFVLLAGALMFLAPKTSDGPQLNANRSAPPSQAHQYGAQYGQQQQSQPGQHTTNYLQQPGGPQQQPYGGYSSGGPQQ